MEVTLLRVNQLGSQSSAFKIESVLFFVALSTIVNIYSFVFYTSVLLPRLDLCQVLVRSIGSHR